MSNYRKVTHTLPLPPKVNTLKEKSRITKKKNNLCEHSLKKDIPHSQSEITCDK